MNIRCCVLLLLLTGAVTLGAQEAPTPESPDDGLDLGRLPQFAEVVDTLKDRLKDQAALATYEKSHWLVSLPPTRLGYSFRVHDPRAKDQGSPVYHSVSFDTNVGISWLWSDKNDVTTPWSLAWGANLFYSGSYDFRMDLESGPVLSRLQNPQVSLFIDWMGSRGAIAANWTLGWAHESNGQYASEPGDFQLLGAIDPHYKDQFFASMGWDYYFLRFTRYWKWTPLVVMPHIEIRHLIRQAQGNPLNVNNIEDKANITGLAIRGEGIRAYDGLRLGTLWSTGPGYHGTIDLILPTLWDLNQDFLLWDQVGLEAYLYFDQPVTWYLGAKWGTRADPAYYFARELMLGAGITIQSIDFWPK